MVEKNLVQTKLKELRDYVRQLDRYKGITIEELEESLEKTWSIERGLQLSIQLVLDVGGHILSEEGVTVESYSEIIEELGRQDILPRKFAKNIKGMAGFRNILVHDYLEVDLKLLVKLVNNNLSDFRKFAQYILKYVKNE